MKLRIISLFVFLCLGMIWTLKAQELKKISYGSKDGMDLVMGVKKPKNPNGAGVIMVVSGGFKSSWEQALNMSHLSSPPYCPWLHTVFVIHSSQPRYAALDAINDVRRAVRFIRYHAEKFEIDGNRLGITGGSSGGETSLCIATQSDDGNPRSEDPVERESSRVQAVACFFHSQTSLIGISNMMNTDSVLNREPIRAHSGMFD